MIQPKPASNSLAFHSFAATSSSASSSGVFSSRTPTESEPSPQTNFSSPRVSALASRKRFASALNVSSVMASDMQFPPDAVGES